MESVRGPIVIIFEDIRYIRAEVELLSRYEAKNIPMIFSEFLRYADEI